MAEQQAPARSEAELSEGPAGELVSPLTGRDGPEELDEGPYGLRGKHTPPLQNMFGAYTIIFGLVVLVPLILFVVVRFLIL